MRIDLTADQVQALDRQVDELSARYASVEDEGFADDAALLAQELPRSLREPLLRFRLGEPQDGLFLLRGLPIDGLEPTPEHWNRPRSPSSVFRQECAFFLLAQLLGEPVAWRTQQDGSLMHDILPVRGHEGEQLGTGSEQLLWWHTEDAFHPYRGDYLGMMCLRNPDRIPTTVCSVAELDLDPKHVAKLFEPLYTIRPDESHQVKNSGQPVEGPLSSSYAAIERMLKEPQKLAVLFGDPAAPYLRLDPYFMDPSDDPEAQAALDGLVEAVDERLRDLVLEAGDVCFFDNYQVVHGRKPFRARYDGTDRWLKRLNIVRDLRKSRSARARATSRVIG